MNGLVEGFAFGDKMFLSDEFGEGLWADFGCEGFHKTILHQLSALRSLRRSRCEGFHESNYTLCSDKTTKNLAYSIFTFNIPIPPRFGSPSSCVFRTMLYIP